MPLVFTARSSWLHWSRIGNQDLGCKVKSLDGRWGELECDWLQAGRRDGVWGMCFGEEGTGPKEDGTLDIWGVGAQSLERKSYELGSVRE